MSKYQLWSRDEYGQGSILMTSEDIDEVVKKGKEEVTNINVNNALTADDRERNWEAYFVDISSSNKKKVKYIYGGPNPRDKKTIYAITPKTVSTISLSDVPKAEVKIYLGNISNSRNVEKSWWGTDAARRPITNLDHQELNGKTMFFVKKVD